MPVHRSKANRQVFEVFALRLAFPDRSGSFERLPVSTLLKVPKSDRLGRPQILGRRLPEQLPFVGGEGVSRIRAKDFDQTC